MKRAIWIFVFLIGLFLIPMLRRRSPISSRFIAGTVGLDREGAEWTVSAQLLTDKKTTIQLSGETVADAIARSVEKTGQGMELRQNKMLCIGEKTAETYHLSAIIDYLVRTGNGRLTTDVVICRGSAATLLESASSEQMISLTDRSVLFAQGIRSRLLDICRTLADSGDAVIPIIRIEQERAVMDGAAVFVAGKWMAELSADQMTGLSLLQNQAENCTVTTGAVTAELYDLSRSIKVQSVGDTWKIAVNLRAYASIQEQLGSTAADSVDISRAVEDYIASALQVTAKAYGSDVCGLWDSIKKQMPFTASLSDSERKQHLKSSDYEVTVSVEITETGIR